jgi:hypothetical protein
VLLFPPKHTNTASGPFGIDPIGMVTKIEVIMLKQIRFPLVLLGLISAPLVGQASDVTCQGHGYSVTIENAERATLKMPSGKTVILKRERPDFGSNDSSPQYTAALGKDAIYVENYGGYASLIALRSVPCGWRKRHSCENTALDLSLACFSNGKRIHGSTYKSDF